ncbi:calcium-binding protein [Leisingera sp. S232]|uniref:calcium-binding protein n=1 Tax=Leisingera sp. S232 TaxID=3415132 RepID=UPI003C799694
MGRNLFSGPGRGKLFNRINGDDDDNTIAGSGAADRINAGDGNDTVTGGLGDDILFGNDGTDTAVFFRLFRRL